MIIGMSRTTGQPVHGVAYLVQCIEDVLTTPLGSRRMRPEYGSSIRQMVDLPMNEGWKSAVQAETVRALSRWIPTFKLSSAQVVSVLNGTISFTVKGQYLGDNVTLQVSA